jgi:hypothetical protein
MSNMDKTKNKEWLFHGACGATNKDIIRWWESRRFYFNAYVGLTGVVSWFLVLVVGGASVKPGVDFEEPLAMLVGPILYVVLANICYTFGWIVDVVSYNDGPRKGLFRAGLIFSVVLTALPGLWAIVAYVSTVYTGKKLD